MGRTIQQYTLWSQYWRRRVTLKSVLKSEWPFLLSKVFFLLHENIWIHLCLSLVGGFVARQESNVVVVGACAKHHSLSLCKWEKKGKKERENIGRNGNEIPLQHSLSMWVGGWVTFSLADIRLQWADHHYLIHWLQIDTFGPISSGFEPQCSG